MGKNAENVGRIGERLKTARKAAGLTQSKLGQKAGSNHVQVSRIEAGQIPTLDMLARLADALGVDSCDLLCPPKPRRKRP